MNAETIAGTSIVVAALMLLVGLVAWSRRAIERIAERDLKSVRDIVKDFRNGS